MKKKHNYSAKVHQGFAGLVVLVTLSVIFVGSVLAFFVSDDWASNFIGLSGKVDIEVVSRANTYRPIEDTDTDTKLIIYFEDNYSVHIPGAWIEPTANIRVSQSTTKPLLRAIMTVHLIDMTTGETVKEEDGIDILNLAGRLYDSLSLVVENNGWMFYPEDDYFYYIGSNTKQAILGETELHQVDATGDAEYVYVHFIDTEIQFPEDIGSEYSGYGVRFVITFEAIQNFIPDRNGVQLDNTITNAKKIFDNPDSYEGIT